MKDTDEEKTIEEDPAEGDFVDDLEESNLGFEISEAVPHQILHMRCAVHTLQLAILDGLKKTNSGTIISHVRRVVKKALVPKLYESLKEATGICVILDNDTRWGSTFLMLQRLCRMKDELIKLSELAEVSGVEDHGNMLRLTAEQWKQVGVYILASQKNSPPP